ncbi:Membrane-associated zinc metalloprotease [Wolbachia endosymbiont of Drosophila simulans wNo]|uniref:RIP metalloprotease RseP n=1 Tax=unclassified Wolbachia TaxID=2640676 RepID=UPI0002D24F4D|nr:MULTISPECIES: RIP metalloprotease RseP [unclassified Wolbachia]AGJ99158.1 Membrane-associated zinc metalloprotease [Wolbachia endosymbiont of Drosophila simulans wNo]QCB62230.1 RIP metalloprotease RseP [Wolbachia endosymbiont of Drosophila mauritiana]QCB63277.1 RIP metalloprotease RseP [Wolbachia endosymbiont of Drosophila mauritiana]QWE33460.1 Membrane-associated zinc metalloprotease, putative [Wolbachia endosymbiont of Drosophila simulans]TGB07727.1 RIP metalloprotease RseP [Wolbachia end
MELVSHQLSAGIYYFLSFSLIISIIVFVHECGHYIIAKACKVKVESFSIGFGPEIFGFNDKSGTRWKLSAFPLGGYVKMLGDTNAASVPVDQQKLTEEEKLHSFHTKPRYQKAAIVFAGPFANMIFTVIAFTIFFSVAGYYRTPPVIGNVIEESAAKQAGLLPGDTITQINEYKIKYFEDISRVIMSNPETRIEIKYSRNNEEYRTILTPVTVEDRDVFGNIIERKTIGITSINMIGLKQSSFLGAASLSVNETYHTMCLTIKALFQIVVGKRSINEIGGPIKIAKYSGQSAKKGLIMVLYFMAIISANLAAINLLPIPLLDGGHLFHYIIEAVIRRDLSLKYQKYAATFGATILFLLMAVAITNDIRHLF